MMLQYYQEFTMLTKLLILSLLFLSIYSFTVIQTNLPQRSNLKDIPWPYTICGKGKWTIESLTISSIPARGNSNLMTVLGTAEDDQTFTAVDLEVRLNGVFLHSDSIPFQASYSQDDTIQFKYMNSVPTFAPPGNYMLIFKFKSGSVENGCMSWNFKL